MRTEPLTWNDRNSLGIPMIDEQHRHFFDVAGRMRALAEKPDVTKDEVLFALTEFGDHAFLHFDSEMGLLRERGYPGADAHEAEHVKFKKRITLFIEQIRGKNADARSLAREAAEFADDWITEHMLGTTDHVVEFLRGRSD